MNRMDEKVHKRLFIHILINDNNQLSSILNGCRNNDRKSQKALYELVKGYAMIICSRYQSKAEQTEEMVNEGFVKLFKNIHQFDESRHTDNLVALKGWFKRILINICIDHSRRKTFSLKGHILTKETEAIQDHNENGIDVLSYKEIIGAIRELSPAYRMAFNLFVIEGMTHEEIGDFLGISIGTSKSNLSKARGNLRRILNLREHIPTGDARTGKKGFV